MITLIVPLRLSTDRLYDEIERLDRIAASVPRERFEILVVDFGTPDDRIEELAAFQSRHPHVRIARTSSPEETFSVGAARDFGVTVATSPVVMFNDLDFICQTETYRQIADIAEERNLAEQAYDFLCVPTIFLTDAGTRNYLEQHARPGRATDRAIHQHALRNVRSDHFEHFSVGSSALLVNRHFYLMSGGHDRSFIGHGAEDFEFYNRLSHLGPRAPRPAKFADDIPIAAGKWEGFRSYFALYGMDLWMSGVSLVHLHHPRREQTDDSYRKSRDNFTLLKSKLQEFQKSQPHLRPLGDPHVKANALVLVEPSSMPARSLRSALPALGQFRMVPEQAFESPELLLEYIAEEAIDTVLFLNPYGNPHRLALYEAVRRARIKAIAFDRGCLPDSWFFDDAGFLGNSLHYAPEAWDQPLPDGERETVLDWMRNYAQAGVTLEANENRRSADHWKMELGIGDRKMIFVALQRPNDTATRFFAGPAGTYQNYIDWLAELVRKIDRRRYVVVLKKHPLESERPHFEGAKYVADSANIHDLIELADKVVVLNSGTGVVSLIMDKPVIVCGHAYYCWPGLAHQATSAESLLDLCTSDLTVDREAVARYVHHLKERFYSFGPSKYVEVPEAGGAARKICNRIDFSILKGLPKADVRLGNMPEWLRPGVFLSRGVGFNAAASNASTPAKPATAIPQPTAAALTRDLRPSLSLSGSASRSSDGVIKVTPGSAGHAVYGPYIRIDEGKYKVALDITAQATGLLGHLSSVKVEVAADGGNSVLASRKVPVVKLRNGGGHQELEFSVPGGGKKDLEVRVWTDGRNSLDIKGAQLLRD